MNKKVLRVTAWISGLIFIFLLIFFAGIQYLGTQAGSKWALAQAQSILKSKFATELEFSSAKFELFSRFQFSGLKIVSKYKGNKIDLKLQNLDLEYSLNFFSRKLKVKRFLIDRPQFQVQYKASSEKAQANDGKNSNDGMQSLANFIYRPLVQIDVENFELRDLDLDFKFFSEESQISALVGKLNFQSGLLYKQNQISSHGKLVAHGPNRFELLNGENRISGDWTSDSEWQINLHGSDQNWIYQISPANFNFVLRNLNLLQKSKDAEMHVQMPLLKLASQAKIEAQTQDLFKFTADSVKIANSNSNISTEAIQGRKNSAGKSLSFAIKSNEILIKSELKREIEVQVSSESKNIILPNVFLLPVDFKLASTLSIASDFRHMDGKLAGSLSGFNFVNGQASIAQAQIEAPWDIQALFKLKGDPRVVGKLRSGASILKMGVFEIQSKINGAITQQKDVQLEVQTDLEKFLLPISKQVFAFHIKTKLDWQNQNQKAKTSSLLELSNPDFGEWKIKTNTDVLLGQTSEKEASGDLEITEVRPSQSKILPAKILKPMKFTHHIKLDQDNLQANVQGEMPLIEVPKLGILHDTKLDLKLTGDHLSTDKNVNLVMSIEQGAVQVTAIPAEIPIANMKMSFVARLKQQIYFNLERFQFSLNQDLVNITAEGSGNLQTKDLQIQANSRVLFPKSFPAIFGVKLFGEVSTPMTLAVRKARDISIDGNINFKHMGASKDNMGIAGFNGSIPFSEHLVKEKEHIRFTELVTQNAFERVNFERLRPLLQSAQLLTIEKLQWQEKTFGPLTGFFSIRQNMIILHEFNVDLGSGSVYGEMAFDVYPKNLQLGLLSRVTGVDLGQVLPKKFLLKIPQGDKTISARTGFIFSINKAMLNGRIDVTQIGSAQMITLINLLDPQFQDDKMNKMRVLLEVGYPTAVAMNFRQGYLDLDLDLNAFGIANHQALRSIPISGFLLKPTADIISASQKGPLK